MTSEKIRRIRDSFNPARGIAVRRQAEWAYPKTVMKPVRVPRIAALRFRKGTRL